LNRAYIAFFGVKKGDIAHFKEAYGKSKTAFYTRSHLAYQASLSQERISLEVLEGSPSLFAVAVSVQETVWIGDLELHGYVKPHSPARCGYREKKRHPKVNSIGGRANGTGIQSEEAQKGAIRPI